MSKHTQSSAVDDGRAEYRASSPKVAVVGAGGWGKNLVRNFYQIGNLARICEINPSLQQSFRSQYPDVQTDDNLEEVLSDPDLSAIALATPAVTHHELALAALRAGKDVFVEKPVALVVDQAEELVRVAEQEGRILMVGHILQYHPAVIELKRLVSEGALGRIQYLYSNRLNHGKIRTEENTLWSFAPHDISVMLHLLDEQPAEVSCRGEAYLSSGIVDVTVSQFGFPSGVSAHIFVSWLHPFKEQRFVVVGSRKMAVFDDLAADKLVLYPHRVEWRDRLPTAVKAEAEVVPLPTVEPLRAECEHFLGCVSSRNRPKTDGQEGARVLRVLNACQDDLERASVRGSGTVPRVDVATKAGRDADYFIHPTAVVDEPCDVGEETKVWHFAHIQKGARIGKRCVFGQNTNVANDVVIGNNVKVQNNVSIYTGVEIEDDVFLGPSCVLTNVTNPRSQVNRHSLYERTRIRRGASIGANATVVCGIEIGRYAFVAAGSVVTKDVPDYALVQGSPARQVGWMSRHGHRLLPGEVKGEEMTCPESGFRYRELEPGVLRCLDLDEEAPLPEDLAQGSKSYDSFKVKSPG